MESSSILNRHPNGVVIRISITSLRKSIFQHCLLISFLTLFNKVSKFSTVHPNTWTNRPKLIPCMPEFIFCKDHVPISVSLRSVDHVAHGPLVLDLHYVSETGRGQLGFMEHRVGRKCPIVTTNWKCNICQFKKAPGVRFLLKRWLGGCTIREKIVSRKNSWRSYLTGNTARRNESSLLSHFSTFGNRWNRISRAPWNPRYLRGHLAGRRDWAGHWKCQWLRIRSRMERGMEDAYNGRWIGLRSITRNLQVFESPSYQWWKT